MNDNRLFNHDGQMNSYSSHHMQELRREAEQIRMLKNAGFRGLEIKKIKQFAPQIGFVTIVSVSVLILILK